MSARITLTLPDEVLRRAELLAQRTGRSVDEVLADGLRSALMPLGEPVADESAVAAWTNEEVLAAADGTMPPDQDRRLGELLERQQADQLAAPEGQELHGLMQVYQTGLLRKAAAPREAVRRGLRGPLGS